MDTIPLFKVAMHDDQSILTQTIQSGYIGEGPRVRELEERLGAFFEAEVLATNSCTSALDLAYHLLNLKAGSEVISTPMTCLATNTPLALRGCMIKWADVDPRTGNIDPPSVRRLFTAKTKAVVCTDWAGRPCDYDEVRKAAPGVPIVEDAAHAFGAQYKNNPITWRGGDYIAWSFQAIKHLTTGDGGALKVPLAQRKRARLLRWYGLDRNSSASMRCNQQIPEPGFKYQMNDIAASIGLANLEAAKQHVSMAQHNAQYYCDALPEGIVSRFDKGSSYWIFTILVKDPQDFETRMAERGVQVSQVHTRNDRQRAIPSMRSNLVNQGIDEFSSHMISIPVGWWVTGPQLVWIKESVLDSIRAPVGVIQ